MQAAIPKYAAEALKRVGNDSLPPGHRFRLYFRGYEQDWGVTKTEKQSALKEVTTFHVAAKTLLRSLRERQQQVAKLRQAYRVEGWTTAPFTAGLGNEHPLENGFSFLDPYGIPYYPGASVKGVVRRAAEELALFEQDSRGWTLPAVWWLFGFDLTAGFFRRASFSEAAHLAAEASRWRQAYQRKLEGLEGTVKELFETFVTLVAGDKKEKQEALRTALKEGDEEKLRNVHVQGALTFWDVLPIPPSGSLRVDIMNPHYGHYYQEGESPGDWGEPKPIFYLTLPENTSFLFVVDFRPPLAWPEIVRTYFEEHVENGPRWEWLLSNAFNFAFEWLGFGAKTSIGYGRLQGKAAQQPGPKLVSSEELGQLVTSPSGGKETKKSLEHGTLPVQKKQPGQSSPEGPPATMSGSAGEDTLEQEVRLFDFSRAQREGLRALLEKIRAVADEEKKRRLIQLLQLPNIPLVRVVLNDFPDLAKYRR